TGGDPSYRRLAEALRAEGYRVSEQPTSPIGAHSSSADASGVLDGVDMAFLAVRDADDVSAIGPVRPFQRVARDVGIMQGQLGMDRVVLLVEDSVAGLSSDLGVGILRLPPGGADGAIDEIKRRIEQAVPTGAAGAGAVAVAAREPDRGIHQKLSAVERSRADSMFMPILLFGVIALMAVIGAIVIAASLLSGGGDDDGARVQLIDVTESLRAGQSGSGVGSIGEAGDDGGDGDEAAGSGQGSSAQAPAPAGPSAGFGGDNQLLPATCELDLLAASLDEATDCDGAGVLVLDGPAGPWHNQLRAIALSDGVSGEVVYERTGAVQALEDGFEVLDADEAEFGVSSITVSFSAVGQHIHLLDAAERPDREATLTLRLDR
ncbi:MAG: hypothetical protein AAGA93_25235, partial [Actinomycetota bacterium]